MFRDPFCVLELLYEAALVGNNTEILFRFSLNAVAQP